MNKISVFSSGEVEFCGKKYRCAIGKSGIFVDKKEGDGATPSGCFALREVFYRADRLSAPDTQLPIRSLNKNDGWCDDSNDKNYNKLVVLPYNASHENLWRDDEVYDIIVVVGYNDNPPTAGEGSAIFMHIARPDYTPTAGCIALAKEDLLSILKDCDKNTEICINA